MLGLIVYGLAALERVPTPLAIGAFVLVVACAVVIVYGLWMLLITSAFWFVRVENVVESYISASS